MTRQDILDAVTAERYGPPIRQHTGADGPTARWNRHQRELADRVNDIRALWAEGWRTRDIAELLGVPNAMIHAVIAADST
jgi:hypothetical protein